MLPPASIFREYDIRGVVGETLTEDYVRRIGQAFASAVIDEVKAPNAIAVGYDGRLSSPDLSDALCEGIRAAGVNVLHIGRVPTPQLYYAVCTEHTAAGIMITGSHNPPSHNGLKMMLGTKPFYGDAIRALRERLADNTLHTGQGGYQEKDITNAYVRTLVSAYDGATPLNVAWDSGNGAAGEIMQALCQMLPGKHTALNAIIDGTFPAHHPDPTVPENLIQLIDTVRAKKLDAGIAFDGDGDRIGVVDEEGEILWGDQLLALYAADILKSAPGSTIIADVKASQTLFDEVARLGGNPLMWKTGHSHIKAKMAELRAPLAGEMSGHMFFADRYFGFDDGLYAAVRLLSLLSRSGKKLSELRKALPTMVSTPEMRIECEESQKFALVERIKAQLQQNKAQFSDVDGVRVNNQDGWWLLRASNTQAIIVARCESATAEGLERLKNELKHYLGMDELPIAAGH